MLTNDENTANVFSSKVLFTILLSLLRSKIIHEDQIDLLLDTRKLPLEAPANEKEEEFRDYLFLRTRANITANLYQLDSHYKPEQKIMDFDRKLVKLSGA